MKIKETSEDKASWGQGEWIDEPDRKQWKDPATGYTCLINRVMHSGHLCGYVAVPPGHPAHGKDYDSVDVSVHGGLTYGASCRGEICHVPEPGEPDDVWWLGFDCAHCQDISPRIQAMGLHLEFPSSFPISYKNVAYVEAECLSLAQQLKEMESADEQP